MTRIIIESETFERVEIEIDPRAMRLVRARVGMPIEAGIDHLLGAALISRMLSMRDGDRLGRPNRELTMEEAKALETVEEAGRCATIAITELEKGIMFAVKAHMAGL